MFWNMAKGIWKRMIFVCAVRAGHHRWLVCGRSPALRTHLAGPIGIDSSFCCQEKTYPPPAAAIVMEYRAHALTSTVLHNPPCPTSGRSIEQPYRVGLARQIFQYCRGRNWMAKWRPPPFGECNSVWKAAASCAGYRPPAPLACFDFGGGSAKSPREVGQAGL
jgi:hypothetical protein